MKVLIVNQAEVHELLPMNECMDVMAETLKALAGGDALNPLRRGMLLPEKAGIVATMLGYCGEIKALGVKVISVFPGNEGTEYDSHQGAVLLLDAEHGSVLAMMDASGITAVRTAAVSGIATRVLAREDADDLAILGSGVQAHTHLEAILLTRQIRRVRVWSRTLEHAETFAQRESQRHGIQIDPMPTAQHAVEEANIICTVTSSSGPVLMGDWIAPGAHINAVGSSQPSARELDTAAMAKSRLFVDRRESAVNEAGDFLIPKKEGVIGDDHIQGELGEVLLGQVSGRRAPEEITVFKSLGLAVEDVASAHHIYQKAVEMGVGTWVEFGGSRHHGG
jgi:ornithine cyclodeaminase